MIEYTYTYHLGKTRKRTHCDGCGVKVRYFAGYWLDVITDITTKPCREWKDGLFLCHPCNKIGYNVVCFRKNNKRKHFLVHRLMAKQFLSNPLKKKQINHKDGNKLNNNINNIEWSTCEENIRHCWKNNLHSRPFGENNSSAKLTEFDVKEIRKTNKPISLLELAKKYKVDKTTIHLIIKRKTWKHI